MWGIKAGYNTYSLQNTLFRLYKEYKSVYHVNIAERQFCIGGNKSWEQLEKHIELTRIIGNL